MFINVIDTSHPSSVDYLVFPDQNPMNNIYIQNQLSRFSDSLTGIGRQFLETSKAIYESINDASIVRIAKAALKAAKGIMHPNIIVELETIDDVRSAQLMMQRFVMAEPTIRGYFHKQKCDGYSDSYVDLEPGKVADAHYDYRRVMDGVITDGVDEDGDYEWSCKNYLEDLLPGDKELDGDEKVAILRTWDVVRMAIEASEDPTCVFSGKLGA